MEDILFVQDIEYFMVNLAWNPKLEIWYFLVKYFDNCVDVFYVGNCVNFLSGEIHNKKGFLKEMKRLHYTIHVKTKSEFEEYIRLKESEKMVEELQK